MIANARPTPTDLDRDPTDNGILVAGYILLLFGCICYQVPAMILTGIILAVSIQRSEYCRFQLVQLLSFEFAWGLFSFIFNLVSSVAMMTAMNAMDRTSSYSPYGTGIPLILSLVTSLIAYLPPLVLAIWGAIRVARLQDFVIIGIGNLVFNLFFRDKIGWRQDYQQISTAPTPPMPTAPPPDASMPPVHPMAPDESDSKSD